MRLILFSLGCSLLAVALTGGVRAEDGDAPEWATPRVLDVVVEVPVVTAAPVDDLLPPGERFVIVLERDGKAHFGLASGDAPLATTSFSMEDMDVNDEAMDAIRKALRAAASNEALRNPDRSSRVWLLLRCDRRAPWFLGLWLMQLAADPGISMYRLQLAVETPGNEGGTHRRLSFELPRDRSGPPRDERTHVVKATLFVDREFGTGRALKRLKLRHGLAHGMLGEGLTTPLGTVDLSDPAAGGPDVLRPGLRLGALRRGLREVFAAVGQGERDARFELGLGAENQGLVTVGDVLPVLAEAAAAGFDLSLRGIALSIPDTEEIGPLSGLSQWEPPPPSGAFAMRSGRARHPGGRDAAVEAALTWLAAHQDPNGSWGAEDFALWCDGDRQEERPDGLGRSYYDVGVTGLSVSAFLGAGYTNRGRHPFAKVVAKGLRYLKNVQDTDGCFGSRSPPQYVYNHAAAALAMVEAYGMTGSPIFRGSAQKALDFIALCRNPYFAWRYGIKPGDNDTSVTGWMALPLESARLINAHAEARGRVPPLRLDESAWDGVEAWLDKMTDPDTGRVGYIQRGAGSARPMEMIDRFPTEKTECMTAIGVLLRLFLREDPHADRVIARGVDLLTGRRPRWDLGDGSIDMVYWYWGTMAMFQIGARGWRQWNAGITDAILRHQRKDTTPCLY
ncbi:MAG: prenyltransferase/squalene oxidase repeat-containing protein, partial [Planctomycetota bacterium]